MAITKLYKGSDVMEVPEFDAGYWSGQGWSTSAPTTPKSDLYIGATNWANLQKQYTPNQLSQATQKVGNDIFWNPNVNIADIPKVPNKIATTEMGTGSGLSNLQAPAPLNDIPGLMAATKPTEEGLKSYLEQAQASLPSQQTKDAYTKRLDEFAEENKTAGRDLQEEMWQRFQMQPNVEQLQKLLPQMAALQANFEKGIMAQEGKVASASSIYGRQALMQRQQAVEMAGLGAMAQAYQGNIEMARTLSQDAINAKYADDLNYINNIKSQLAFIEQDLNREETTKLNQLQAVLNERERNIANAKELETNLSNLMITAAQAGASQSELDKIMKAPDYLTAVKLAQPYLIESGDIGKWEESDITDADGNPMIFNPSTGEYRKALGTSTSNIFFTDANGDSWNIAGWAVDQTKPQQMNAIAKRIGKLTDENLAEKVREFTPALTPEMIKEASAMSGVSWEAIMTMVVQESLGGTSNVAKANNNFGGLTFNNQEWIKPFGGVKGTARPSAEGGNYIKFPTKQQGLNAMAALMASYGKVDTTPKVSDEVSSLTQLVAEGKLTDKEALAQVSKQNKQQLLDSLSKVVSIGDTLTDIVAKEKAQLALDLTKHKGLNNAVGTISLGRMAPFQWGQKSDFIASVEQLVSGLSLESLIEAKSRGATFGALSDTEMRILASAATKIGTWRKFDKNSNVVGYKASESAFRAELEKINQTLLRGVKNNIETGSDPLGLGLNANSTNPLGL